MRVLITTDLFKPTINGVVTSILNLEQELKEQGHEVKILAVSQNVYSYREDNVYYVRSVPSHIRKYACRYQGQRRSWKN